MFKKYIGSSPKCVADTFNNQITLIKLETDSISESIKVITSLFIKHSNFKAYIFSS